MPAFDGRRIQEDAVTGQSMGEITFYLKLYGTSLLVLSLLLALINLSIYLLRRRLGMQNNHNRLDQIGREAIVIRTIRPHKPGRIRYQTAQGPGIAEAIADEVIRNGSRVRIAVVQRGHYRVSRVADQASAVESGPNEPADHQPTLRQTVDHPDTNLNQADV